MATRIMVIDDEPLICRLLEYQLGGHGYEVTAYQSGRAALLRLAHEQPDLILLDVMMPELSGWDLCRQLRGNSAVPVIMLTAKQADDDVVEGLTSGADDYIGKPFSELQLVARIEAVLRRSRAAKPRPAAPELAVVSPPAYPLAATTPAPPTNLAVAPAIPLSTPTAPAPEALPRLGPHLAAARQRRGLSLHGAERACGVRWEFLQAIEQEQFSYVPREALRQALRSYAALLEIDLKPYLGRGGRRRRRPAPLSLTVSMAAVLAIALVLLAFIM